MICPCRVHPLSPSRSPRSVADSCILLSSAVPGSCPAATANASKVSRAAMVRGGSLSTVSARAEPGKSASKLAVRTSLKELTSAECAEKAALCLHAQVKLFEASKVVRAQCEKQDDGDRDANQP